MQELDLQFVLTVPAVWSDKAKDATMRAAAQAGKDDVFIICDAGGGTVDLISYQIKNLEPLRLAEVTEGIGAV
ncbi:hypothetical protein BDW69DRAFT_186085 [Aspergillus filifer]